eukprot:COSAG01_NODE_23893_length_798_cov_0.705293_2_plen_74_part_01
MVEVIARPRCVCHLRTDLSCGWQVEKKAVAAIDSVADSTVRKVVNKIADMDEKNAQRLAKIGATLVSPARHQCH